MQDDGSSVNVHINLQATTQVKKKIIVQEVSQFFSEQFTHFILGVIKSIIIMIWFRLFLASH